MAVDGLADYGRAEKKGEEKKKGVLHCPYAPAVLCATATAAWCATGRRNSQRRIVRVLLGFVGEASNVARVVVRNDG